MTGMASHVAFVRLLGVGVPAWCLLLAAAGPGVSAGDEGKPPSGDSVIRARAGRSEIVITTTRRVAGAVHSVTWDGKEFIDSFDHGRQLQSASNFAAAAPLVPETFNPTEAGSASDGRGDTSSSRLLHFVTTPDGLQSTTQMAFWLRPGEKSLGHPAVNTAALSNHLLTKRVKIGHRAGDRDLPHVIRCDVTFSVPVGERHALAQFEVLTGYMPPEFGRFWEYNSATKALEPLSDGPGEQPAPVVLATESGGHAMGIYCPPQEKDYGPAGYGRFRFRAEKVNKWNCVYRLRDDARGVEPGDYAFRAFVIVGELEVVKDSMRALHVEFADGAKTRRE
jgi:hypothetical protein